MCHTREMDIAEFRNRLADSRLEPRILSACLAITDILAKLRPGDGQHLGLPFFYERLRESPDRDSLLPALSILSSKDGAILEVHGYLDDAEEGQLHLSNEDFRELLHNGKLAHPTSGELVSNPLEQVRIFYSLRDEF